MNDVGLPRSKRPTIWLPDGALEGTRWALGIEYRGESIAFNFYRNLLAEKFDKLIQRDVKAARFATECLFESIALNYSPHEWAIQLVMCDQLMPYLSSLTGAGKVVSLRSPQDFHQILENLSGRQ